MTPLFLGVTFARPPCEAFSTLMEHNLIPVTIAGQKENQVVK
jgi:hypothetical protein